MPCCVCSHSTSNHEWHVARFRGRCRLAYHKKCECGKYQPNTKTKPPLRGSSIKKLPYYKPKN